MTLDDLRTAHPELGLAVYAYEPNGAVTFEVHTPDGQVFSWRAVSEAGAIALAFPPPAPTEAGPSPASVFD